MFTDENKIQDGFRSLLRGVNRAVHPSDLSADQCAGAVNVFLRGSRPRTRRPFNKIPLTYSDADAKEFFQKGVFQGSRFYDNGETGVLIVGVSGQLYTVEPDSGVVSNLTDGSGPLPPHGMRVPRLTFQQALEHFIVQDGMSKARIISPTGARESATQPHPDPTKTTDGLAPEVPTGKAMAFGHGRLYVQTGLDIFKGGDLFDPTRSETVLRFSEDQYLNEAKGGFQLPQWMGGLTAMTIVPQVDTGLGLGPLVVSGQNGMSVFAINTARTDWLNTDISVVLVLNSGATGPHAITSVNQDVWYRAQDGVRSVRFARAQVDQPTNFNQSTQLGSYVRDDTRRLLSYAETAFFDSRLWITCHPEYCRLSDPDGIPMFDVRHRGIVTMDAEALATLEGVSSPAFDGLQTGIFPLSLVKGTVQTVDRLWIWSKDNGYINGLYEAASENLHWIRPDIGSVPIEAKIETRRFDFQLPFELKRVFGADMWVSELADELTVELLFRPDDWQEWIPWKILRLKPTIAGDPFDGPQEVLRQDRGRLEFGEPPEQTCAGRKLKSNKCFQAQCLIKWSGHMKIDQFRVHAYRENETSTCDADEEIETLRVTMDRQYDYEYAIYPTGEGSWQRTT